MEFFIIILFPGEVIFSIPLTCDLFVVQVYIQAWEREDASLPRVVTMCDPNITIIIMTSDINSIYYHNSKYILKASTEYKK